MLTSTGIAMHFTARWLLTLTHSAYGGRTLEKPRDGSNVHLLSESELQPGPFGHSQLSARHGQPLIVLTRLGVAIRMSDGRYLK